MPNKYWNLTKNLIPLSIISLVILGILMQKISGFCEEVISILMQSVQAKKISINHFVADNIYIYADVKMLSTILRNFVSNAIKFTNINGTISFYTNPEPANVTVFVSVNGVGIDPKIADKMFDISQNITTNGTANEKGPGLGLLICKAFIEKNGGQICVESELGKGTDFKFTIPFYNQ